MTDQIDQLAISLRERYKNDIEQKIQEEFFTLTKHASEIFLNLGIETAEYHTKINRLMAGISYLRDCIQCVQQDDHTWYRNYVKACLVEVEKQNVDAIKGVLFEKLSKY